MTTQTKVTLEMALKAIRESRGTQVLCITRDGTRIEILDTAPRITKEPPEFAVTLKLDSIGFQTDYWGQPAALRSFAQHTATVINNALRVPGIQKSDSTVVSIWNEHFTPPKLGKIWWLGNGNEISKREIDLVNNTIKAEYPLSIPFGTALQGNLPKNLTWQTPIHLFAEIQRIKQANGVIFVANGFNFPGRYPPDGLYLLDRSGVLRSEGGKLTRAWPTARN